MDYNNRTSSFEAIPNWRNEPRRQFNNEIYAESAMVPKESYFTTQQGRCPNPKVYDIWDTNNNPSNFE